LHRFCVADNGRRRHERHHRHQKHTKDNFEDKYKVQQRQNVIPNIIVSNIIKPFDTSFDTSFDIPFGISKRPLFEDTFGRGRRFIGPFDLMEPGFFGTSRLQHDVGKMFNDQDLKELEQECKLDDTKEESKHLKFTSKLVSIGYDGVKRSRVVNGVTKIGKDGKPITHKKMISSDDTGKTITEVFADGTERTTKQPFIKGKEHDRDSD
jgi:hypothetical protein